MTSQDYFILYLLENTGFRVLECPRYVVRSILMDRLTTMEWDRVNRNAQPVSEVAKILNRKNALLDVQNRTVQFSGLKDEYILEDSKWTII